MCTYKVTLGAFGHLHPGLYADGHTVYYSGVTLFVAVHSLYIY
jgi:hypothetical protein